MVQTAVEKAMSGIAPARTKKMEKPASSLNLTTKSPEEMLQVGPEMMANELIKAIKFDARDKLLATIKKLYKQNLEYYATQEKSDNMLILLMGTLVNADRVAKEVDALVESGDLDKDSELAKARSQYGDPGQYAYIDEPEEETTND